MSDSQNNQLKAQRKMHVLFLEYNNQRAWLPSSSLQLYKGRRHFEEEAAKAGPKCKKDFVPSKRYQSQFDKAINFSESVIKLPNEDRLETVFQKYGWVMVSEPCDQVNDKRAFDSDCDTEINKNTDTEFDSHPPGDRVTMHRLGSDDRRSSAEAESRLDPGVDSADGDNDDNDLNNHVNSRQKNATPVSKKKKRESSLVAAIAMNGDSSSDDNDVSDSDKVNNSTRKRKRPSSGSESSHSKSKPKKDPPVPAVEPTAAASPVTNATESKAVSKPSDDEFPRLGDLVWGRMSGFPFWPSFVTRSPQGQYKKMGSNGKANYHVQFFNWNDESGWVNAALEFDGLDSFKAIAGKLLFYSSSSKFFRANISCGTNFCFIFSKKEIRQILQPCQGSHVQQVGEGS